MVKKILIIVILVIVALIVIGCGREEPKTVLRVGCFEIPFKRILEETKPELHKQGIKLVITTYKTDYSRPNIDLQVGNLDANCYQHLVFLNFFKSFYKGVPLVPVCKVSFIPLRIYSPKYNFLSEVPDGAKVVICDWPLEKNRALKLLKASGLIKFHSVDSFNPDNLDENPKKLKIVAINFKDMQLIGEELWDYRYLKANQEWAKLPKELRGIDLAIFNPGEIMVENYIKESFHKFNWYRAEYVALKMEEACRELAGKRISLFVESSNFSPYISYLVCREDNKNDYRIKALAKALRSKKIQKFIKNTYKGFFKVV